MSSLSRSHEKTERQRKVISLFFGAPRRIRTLHKSSRCELYFIPRKGKAVRFFGVGMKSASDLCTRRRGMKSLVVSLLCTRKNKEVTRGYLFIFGAPRRIRTFDLPVRSRALYPLSYGRIPMERVMGIEPTRPAWKAGILPLNYTRVVFASRHLKSLSIDSFIIIAHSVPFVNRKKQNF